MKISKEKNIDDKKIKQKIILHEQNNYAKFNENQVEKLLKNIKNNEKMRKNREKNVILNEKTKKNQNRIKTEIDSNIISFPAQQKLLPSKLTDDEIKSLLLGLINLVKKSAISELEQKQNILNTQKQDEIRKSVVELNSQNKKIIALKKENEKLSNEIVVLKSKIIKLRTNFVEK